MLTRKHLKILIDGPVQYVDYANQPVDADDDTVIEDIIKDDDTYIATVSSNLKNYLDNPIESYEKAFRLRPGNGYYDFLDDDEDECKDFAIFDGTPNIHGFVNADDDYFITIFKHNHTYVAYVVREYECGGPIGSFILKRDNYENLLKELNKAIYSY